MAEPRRYPLNKAVTVTLNASGSGTATLGPDAGRGPANWSVDGVILQTNRPGQAPVPRAVVYLDDQSSGSTQGLTYDGSFAQGRCNILVVRGQQIIVTWTGGQAGDTATVTVTGEKW